MKKEIQKEKGSGKSSSPYLGIAVIVLGLFAVLGGVYLTTARKAPAAQQNGNVNLPDYAYASELTLKMYSISNFMQNSFEKIPCYCGCVDMTHGDTTYFMTSLKDCFIQKNGNFEQHASACDLCLYIANDVYDMYNQGKPIKEIRAFIENKYGNGRFGPPTNTPPI